MKLSDYFIKAALSLGENIADKNAAIDKLIELQNNLGNLKDVEAFKKAISEREEQGSTAIGKGIAIPHAKSSFVSKVAVTAITIPSGIDYGAPDGEKCKLFFMIASPDNASQKHLDVLSKLTTLLNDPEFANSLINAKSKKEFTRLIAEKDSGRNNPAPSKDDSSDTKSPLPSKKLVAITACPSGIAHTFMAAEALESKAKDMGVEIRVEKDTMSGPENVLTTDEISAADVVIAACDKEIDMSRFDGKPVFLTTTKEAIHSAKSVIEKAVSDSVSIYHYEGTALEEVNEGSSGIFKKLMIIIPVLIGGGILAAVADLMGLF